MAARKNLDTATPRKVGTGLLGFDPKPLTAGDLAYLAALGIEGPAVGALLDDIRNSFTPTQLPRPA